MSTTNEFRVQYIDDVDPFNVLASLKHAEPTVPKRYSFIADTPLCDQVAGLKRYLRAPHKIDVVALLYYRREENEVKQLDIDATLSELMSEHGIVPDKAGTIVLRTKLSVRVHTIIETLLNAEGNKLRQALFSLKRMMMRTLFLEFVFNQGLNALVNVGKDSDQTFQQYIIKALGEVAVYVDGMNGLMACNELIQWLYLLTESKARMVVKAALELLVVFVNYSEQSDTSTANLSAKGVDSPRMNSPEGLSTALLFKDAVDIVSENRGLKPWFFLINLIDEKSSADADVQAMAMSLINKTLGGLSDEENFYDVVDCLETLGIESCMIYHKNKKKNADLQKEFDKYEETISQAYNIEYETAGRSRKLVRTSTTILPQASTPTAPPAPRRSQSVKPDVGEQPTQAAPPPSALSTKKDAQTSSSAVEDRDKTKVTQTGSKTEQSVKGKSLPQDSKSKVTDQPLSKSKDLSGDESGKQKSSGVKESTSQTAPGSALPSSLLTTTSTTSLASPAQATRPSSAKAAVGSAGQGSPSLSSSHHGNHNAYQTRFCISDSGTDQWGTNHNDLCYLSTTWLCTGPGQRLCHDHTLISIPCSTKHSISCSFNTIYPFNSIFLVNTSYPFNTIYPYNTTFFNTIFLVNTTYPYNTTFFNTVYSYNAIIFFNTIYPYNAIIFFNTTYPYNAIVFFNTIYPYNTTFFLNAIYITICIFNTGYIISRFSSPRYNSTDLSLSNSVSSRIGPGCSI
ncbi:hypothetical protein EMCRGX_G031366 [Ephydatia muelleri]